ncbi:MAG TPA: hypothetical protein VGC39_08950, partial [Candidatus Methylacidiphilales bacterium]
AYMSFRVDQLGNVTAAGSNGSGATYIEDPWGYSYGYFTGATNSPDQFPVNGGGFFDLWSTGGLTGGATGPEGNVNAWIVNWH